MPATSPAHPENEARLSGCPELFWWLQLLTLGGQLPSAPAGGDSSIRPPNEV